MLIKNYCCEAGRRKGSKYSDGAGVESYNEDLVAYRDHQYVLVLDGSSGLDKDADVDFGEYCSSAQWFVHKFAEAIKENIDEMIPTVDLLKGCVREVREQYCGLFGGDREKMERLIEPSASLALVRKLDDKVEVTVLGDISVGVRTLDGRVKLLEQTAVAGLDNQVIDLIKERKTPGRHVCDIVKDEEVRKLLRENRSLKNTPDGYWILGFDEEAVDHALVETYIDRGITGATGELGGKIIDSMLILSDGFADYYKRYKQDYVRAREAYLRSVGAPEDQLDKTGGMDILWNRAEVDSLDNICKDLRRYEERDACCDRYPRFKKSDDASAVLIHFLSRSYVEDHEKLKISFNVRRKRAQGRVQTAWMYLGITKPAVIAALAVPFTIYDFFREKLVSAPSVKDTLAGDASGDTTFRFYWLGVVIFCVAVVYMILSIVRKYRRSAFGTAVISRGEIKDKVQDGLKPSKTETDDGYEIKTFFNGLSNEMYMDSPAFNKLLQDENNKIAFSVRKRGYELPEAVKPLVPAIMERSFEGNRLIYNSKLLRQASHIVVKQKGADHTNAYVIKPKVILQSAKYFAGQCSHEIVYKEFVPQGDIGVSFQGSSLFCDKDKNMYDLDYSTCANFLGASTLVFTRDNRIIIGKQASHSAANKDRFAPSGSGSVDYADIRKAEKYYGRKVSFNDIIKFAMTREFCEECGYSLEDSKSKLKTHLLGYVRLIERGGKPDYFGFSFLDEDSEVLQRRIDESEKGLVDRIVTLRYKDKSEIVDTLEKFCNKYIEGAKVARISIQLYLILQYLKEMVRGDGGSGSSLTTIGACQCETTEKNV